MSCLRRGRCSCTVAPSALGRNMKFEVPMYARLHRLIACVHLYNQFPCGAPSLETRDGKHTTAVLLFWCGEVNLKLSYLRLRGCNNSVLQFTSAVSKQTGEHTAAATAPRGTWSREHRDRSVRRWDSHDFQRSDVVWGTTKKNIYSLTRLILRCSVRQMLGYSRHKHTRDVLVTVHEKLAISSPRRSNSSVGIFVCGA